MRGRLRYRNAQSALVEFSNSSSPPTYRHLIISRGISIAGPVTRVSFSPLIQRAQEVLLLDSRAVKYYGAFMADGVYR